MKHKDGFSYSTMKEAIAKQKEVFDKFVIWLESRTNVVSVTIATPEEDLIGIDLWAVFDKLEHGIRYNPVPIQVKVDTLMHETGNLALETVGQARYGGDWKPGWLSHLHTTEYLVYICAQTGWLRIYRSSVLYKHVIENMSQGRGFSKLSGDPVTEDFWYALGVLMQIRHLEHLEAHCTNLYKDRISTLIFAEERKPGE